MHIILGQKLCSSKQTDLFCTQNTRCSFLKHHSVDMLPTPLSRITRVNCKQDHHRAISASLRPPSYWREPRWRPCPIYYLAEGIIADVHCTVV